MFILGGDEFFFIKDLEKKKEEENYSIRNNIRIKRVMKKGGENINL